MDVITANPGTAQPTLSREGVEAYLRERAPVAIGEGPDATKRAAAKVVRQIGPLFKCQRHGSHFLSSFDDAAVSRAMRRCWLPRCKPALHEDELEGVIEVAKRAFEAAEDAAKARADDRTNAREMDEMRAARRADAAAEIATTKRSEQAEAVRKVAAKLKSSTRYARMVLAEKTTLPDVAAQIAEALGTHPAEHLRRKARSGRNPNLMAILLRPYVEGASLSDFIENPPELAGTALELRDAIAGDGVQIPDHVTQLDPISNFAQSAGINPAAVVDLWRAYKVWRINRLRTIALSELADPFDFG